MGAVKGLKKLWAKGLVNATLRNAQRRHQELLDESSWPEECHHEHPKWLVETINNDWGDDAAEVIEANNQKAPMWIRVNALKHSAQEYQAKLNDVNIESEISNASDVGVLLKRPVAVTKLPDFDSGACSVQDESAQRAAQILDCQPDDVVLDVCAAPGGKTGHILERTPQISKVVAVDISESRLAKVRDNLTRLGFSEKAELTQGDATTPENWSAEQLFNRILLDVPCSGTGVIRRHPDIKYLRRPEDIDALAALQQEILRASWPLLKPGGTMLYATCSIISQENQQNIASFVAATSDANCISIEFLEAENCRDALGLGYRISPKSNRDGFYYALLKKAE